jgi:hypothetical protein
VTIERVLALAGFIVSLLLLARFGPIAWRSWRIYSGVKTRRLADAGPLEIPPPGPAAERLAELRELGFSRIGGRWLQLPGTPVRYEWVVGEPSGETYVAVVPSPSPIGSTLVACYSSFDDGTWLQTTFPRVAVVERPQFHASFVASSVADALAAHRRNLERLRSTLGPPRRVLTMADTLRMDADCRTRHGGATLGGLTASVTSPAIFAAILAVICGLLLLEAR